MIRSISFRQRMQNKYYSYCEDGNIRQKADLCFAKYYTDGVCWVGALVLFDTKSFLEFALRRDISMHPKSKPHQRIETCVYNIRVCGL